MEALVFASMSKVLLALQDPNNDGRKAAERALDQWSANNPIECARELLGCLASSEPEGSRSLAAVLLRRFTAGKREAWGSEVVAGWREALWRALETERSSNVARLACHAVASEAAGAGWPEVCGAAAEMVRARKVLGLQLVDALARAGDETTIRRARDLGTVVAALFPAAAAVRCVASLAKAAPMALAPVARACVAACRAQVSDESLESLVDVATEAPAFFFADDAAAAEAVELAAGLAEHPETRARGLELGCALCEAGRVDGRGLAVVAFRASCEPFSRALAEDRCPPQPLGEDDDDILDAPVHGDDALRRLCAAQDVGATMLACVEKAFESRPRAALAGLHALALGAPGSLAPHVGTAVSLAVAALEAGGPRDVLEACRLAGALAVACRDEVEEKLADRLAEALGARLDGSARLAGAACAALGLLATGDDGDEPIPLPLPRVVPALAAVLSSSSLNRSIRDDSWSDARRAALDAIAQVARAAAKGDMAPWYQTVVPAIAGAIEDLRAEAARCAASVGVSVGANVFEADAPAVLSALRAATTGESEEEEEEEEVLFEYLLPAVVDMASLYGSRDWFSVDFVVPRALEAAAKQPEIRGVEENDVASSTKGGARREADGTYSLSITEDFRVRVDLRAMWAKERAAYLLGDLVDAFDRDVPERLITAVVATLEPLPTFCGSEAVRSSASLSLAQCAEAAVQKLRADASALELAATTTTIAIAACARGLDAETCAGAKVGHAQGLANALEHLLNAGPGGLDLAKSPLLDRLADDNVAFLARTLAKHAAAADDDQLHAQIANALGCLARLGRPTYQGIFDAFVAPFYVQKLDAGVHYAALCVLVDAVDQLAGGAAHADRVLRAAFAALHDDSTDPDLRATAAFAISVVARRDKRLVFAFRPDASAVLRSAADAIAGERDDDDDMMRVRDNLVNAVWELVGADKFLRDWWLAKLPLRADLEEARRANRALLALLENDDPDSSTAVLVVSRLADALAHYDPDDYPEPPTSCLDVNTANRARDLLLAIRRRTPATLQKAFSTLDEPSQLALMQAACEPAAC